MLTLMSAPALATGRWFVTVTSTVSGALEIGGTSLSVTTSWISYTPLMSGVKVGLTMVVLESAAILPTGAETIDQA